MNNMVAHLNKTFMERCRNNEQYSLRAFARSLDLPVSSLSEIMKGKRPLSIKIRDKIGVALKMSDEQIRVFEAQAHGNSLSTNQEILEDNYRQLALDSFYIISDWYHYGILQLMQTKDFNRDPQWIAKRLKIDVDEAIVALERLIRMGIVEEKEDGTLFDRTGGNTSHLKSDFTNDQLRNFQVLALEKAISSVKSIPIQYRDNTTMTLAVSKAAIPFAKKEITRFRRQLTKKLSEFDQPDEVYQLAISLTPLTELDIQQGDKQ